MSTNECRRGESDRRTESANIIIVRHHRSSPSRIAITMHSLGVKRVRSQSATSSSSQSTTCSSSDACTVGTNQHDQAGAAMLDVATLHCMYQYLNITELSMVAAVNRPWSNAVATLPPCHLAVLSTIVRSMPNNMMQHCATVARRHSFSDDAYSFQDDNHNALLFLRHLPHLTSLQCRVIYQSHSLSTTPRAILPSSLLVLDVAIDTSLLTRDSSVGIWRIIATLFDRISRIETIRSLTIRQITVEECCNRAEDNIILMTPDCVMPLTRMTSLRTIKWWSYQGICWSKDIIDVFVTIPTLTRLDIFDDDDACTIDHLRCIATSNLSANIRTFGTLQLLHNDSIRLIEQLSSLTSLKCIISTLVDTSFVDRMLHLRHLSIGFAPHYHRDLRAATIIASIIRRTASREISLTFIVENGHDEGKAEIEFIVEQANNNLRNIQFMFYFTHNEHITYTLHESRQT